LSKQTKVDMMNKLNIREQFALLSEEWAPKVIAKLNGQLTLKLKSSHDIILNEGDMYVMPKGVDHCPVAQPDTHFMIEPS
jgi:ribosomal protein L16 Arg81 hydroxylase